MQRITSRLAHAWHVLAFVSAAMLVAPLTTEAQVSVGQPVELNMKTIDGQTLSSKNLKGKIVLLDFWATWCGPCMAELPHMKKVNETFGKKGLQIVGVSFDQSIGAMKPVIQREQMTWMHVHDGNRAVANLFGGVNSIPRVFILGPDSTLLWTGHPGRMDEALAKAFAEHPPVLVDPKVVKAAQERLQEVNGKLEAGDAKAALKLMSKIPEDAAKDATFAAAADETRGKLDAAAQEMLAAADADAEAGKYTEAATRLRELSISLSGMPVGDEAKKKLNALMGKPEAKKAVEAAQREAQASAALDEAKKLRDAKKHASAYPQFKTIAKAFAGTPSGDEAAAVVKRYEADTAFMKDLTEKEVGGKAKAALSVARSYATAGRKEQAKTKYQAIIKDYAGTEYAKAAQVELNALKK